MYYIVEQPELLTEPKIKADLITEIDQLFYQLVSNHITAHDFDLLYDMGINRLVSIHASLQLDVQLRSLLKGGGH